MNSRDDVLMAALQQMMAERGGEGAPSEEQLPPELVAEMMAAEGQGMPEDEAVPPDVEGEDIPPELLEWLMARGQGNAPPEFR